MTPVKANLTHLKNKRSTIKKGQHIENIFIAFLSRNDLQQKVSVTGIQSVCSEAQVLQNLKNKQKKADNPDRDYR